MLSTESSRSDICYLLKTADQKQMLSTEDSRLKVVFAEKSRLQIPSTENSRLQANATTEENSK